MARQLRGALMLALVAGALVACSSSSATPPKPPLPDSTARAITLLDHVQVDPRNPGLVVVDVERLRSLLGSGTTDLDAAVRSTDQAAKHFAELVQVGLPQLQTAGEWPAGKAALNIAAITAIAGNLALGRDQITVIATTQPFDEIAREFVAAGYVRDGDLLSAGPKVETPESARFVAGGSGLVVLTATEGVAQAAVASTSGVTGPMRDVLTWANAPVVTVAGYAPAANLSPPCITVLAYTDDVTDRRERIVFATDSPSADRVARDGRLGEVEPLIEDRYVTLPLAYDDEHSSANLVTHSTGMPEGSGLYDCP